MAKGDATKAFLARVVSGGAIFREDAYRVAAAEGFDREEIDALASNPRPVFEWEDSNTRQDRIPVQVAEHLVRGEGAATEAMKLVQVNDDPPPQGWVSNDPAVNPMATGQEPFSNTEGAIGTSGQVIDAGEYRDDADDKSSSKASASK